MLINWGTVASQQPHTGIALDNLFDYDKIVIGSKHKERNPTIDLSLKTVMEILLRDGVMESEESN